MNIYRLAAVCSTFLAPLLAQPPAATPQTLFGLVPPSGIRASAVDNSGDIYLAGDTITDVVPVTPNAFQPKLAVCSHSPETGGTCSHGFVVKISRDGTRILYATYLEGSTGTDRPTAIAVDSAGNAYVAGTTSSTDFPVSAGAYQTIPSEGFVTKLNADGSALLGSTYVRGAEPAAIAVDAAGNAYVSGTTTLVNSFPATRGAIQKASPGDIDAFVLKLNPTLQFAAYATFLGSETVDWGYGITVDSGGNAYVTGSTTPNIVGEGRARFPVTAGAYSHQGAGDEIFVAKLNPDGSRLLASTLIGGPQTDLGLAISLDSKGDVYVAGITGSSNFLFAGSIGVAYSFAMKLSADFANLLYSTTLPGRTSLLGTDAFQIALRGDHLILRHHSEGPLYTTPGAIHPCLAGTGPSSVELDENYVVELNAAGNAIAYASYARNAYALGPDSIYVLSSDKDRVFERNALAAEPAGTVTCVASAATFSEGGIAPGEIVSILGSGIGPDTPKGVELGSTGRVVTSLGGVMVRVNGQPAPLLYVSSSQINAVIPFETAGSAAVSVQVVKENSPLNVVTAAAVATMPGAFAIVNPNGTINGLDNPATPGSVLAIFMTGAGVMQPPAETGSIGKGDSRIAANVSVTIRAFIAGKATAIPLEIVYAGDAPGAVQGLIQINAALPGTLPDVAPNASSLLDVRIGDAEVVSVPVRFTP